MNPSYIIVGLGNPGTKYEYTRHNIGFRVVDALIEKHGSSWLRISEHHYEARIRTMGKELLILKPLTYMNLSGTAVKRVVESKGMKPTQVVVVVDEYNFHTGRIHLRQGGSSGGHNGISSLIDELGTPDFWRLRCGIDRNFGSGELVDYVLAPFPEAESDALQRMISLAVLAIEDLARSGPELVMTQINRALPL